MHACLKMLYDGSWRPLLAEALALGSQASAKPTNAAKEDEYEAAATKDSPSEFHSRSQATRTAPLLTAAESTQRSWPNTSYIQMAMTAEEA